MTCLRRTGATCFVSRSCSPSRPWPSREFFISDYFNRDHLRLIIQAFSDPRGGAVVETRRRDGVTP